MQFLLDSYFSFQTYNHLFLNLFEKETNTKIFFPIQLLSVFQAIHAKLVDYPILMNIFLDKLKIQ